MYFPTLHWRLLILFLFQPVRVNSLLVFIFGYGWTAQGRKLEMFIVVGGDLVV